MLGSGYRLTEAEQQWWGEEIARTCHGLGRDELRILACIAARLKMGQDRYGVVDLLKDRRDWQLMKMQELLDAMVYDACSDLTQKQK